MRGEAEGSRWWHRHESVVELVSILGFSAALGFTPSTGIANTIVFGLGVTVLLAALFAQWLRDRRLR